MTPHTLYIVIPQFITPLLPPYAHPGPQPRPPQPPQYPAHQPNLHLPTAPTPPHTPPPAPFPTLPGTARHTPAHTTLPLPHHPHTTLPPATPCHPLPHTFPTHTPPSHTPHTHTGLPRLVGTLHFAALPRTARTVLRTRLLRVCGALLFCWAAAACRAACYAALPYHTAARLPCYISLPPHSCSPIYHLVYRCPLTTSSTVRVVVTFYLPALTAYHAFHAIYYTHATFSSHAFNLTHTAGTPTVAHCVYYLWSAVGIGRRLVYPAPTVDWFDIVNLCSAPLVAWCWWNPRRPIAQLTVEAPTAPPPTPPPTPSTRHWAPVGGMGRWPGCSIWADVIGAVAIDNMPNDYHGATTTDWLVPSRFGWR